MAIKTWTLIDKLKLSELNGNFSDLNTNKLGKTDDSKDNTTTFTEAVTLANIASTESHATLFGKIKKFFSFIGTTTLITTAQTISGAINELVTAMSTQTATLSTPTNVSSVTVHSAIKKSGICDYKLRATCTWTAGTSYTLETLPSGYRPTTAFYKNIQIRDTSAVLGSLTIGTDGVVSIIVRTTISAQLIAIDEMFFV